eukprot:scaffold365142_cov70-Attheya_sp.AAC.1
MLGSVPPSTYRHTPLSRRVANDAPPIYALFTHHPCANWIRLRKDTTVTGENQGPGPTRDRARGTEPKLLGAGNNRQAPITIKKVVVLGSMLGPSALFNTGYKQGVNGDGKELLSST